MRVISWNMGLARGRRSATHDQAWHYLLGLGPDLAFVQEALPPTWIRGEGALIQGPFKQWGSAIFSPRYPLERFSLAKESNLRSLGEYLAFAVASLPDGSDALVASVHARAARATAAQLGSLDPDDVARPSSDGPMVNDVVFVGLHELSQGWSSFLVAGDWNTARHQGGDRASKAGAEFFDRVSDGGWFDCVWDKLGEEVKTWFREGDKLIQDDHAFCDQGLGLRLKHVRAPDDAPTFLGLSDHAPLILDFDAPSIAMNALTETPAGDTDTP
jgi:hypothetical protein